MRFRVAVFLFALAACRVRETAAPDSAGTAAPAPAVREAAVLEGAKVPFVAADPAGGFLVSYVSEGSFRVAGVRGGHWSEAKTVAGGNLLVNSADFPSIAVDGTTLRASWSTRNEHGAVIHLAQSTDGGATWSAPVTPHPDQVSQFGFVSLVSGDSVWLDGRKLKGGVEGEGEMELRASDALLDPRVCDCCQTAAAMTSDGPVVAYRDRSDGEVRDIAYVRRTASGWSEPKLLHADGWKIEGCPVNGPQLDARGRRVVAAWFTAANNEPRVNVAFSDDAAASFSEPVRIDLGRSTGHVDVAFLDDSTAVVTFLDGGALHARKVSRDATLGAPLRIAETGGFPRMAVSQENVGVVWTAGDGVHFATLEGF
jgi:hypothetical protein